MKQGRLRLCLCLVAFATGSCVTGDKSSEGVLDVAEIADRIPERVKDRSAWAKDVRAAIEATDRTPTAERVCTVLAVIEQESGFQVDPVVADLPKIVRRGLLQKLGRLGPLAEPALSALLSGKAPGSNVTFAQRIEKLRTERDLDRLFRDIAAAYRDELPGTYVVASALTRLLGKGGFQEMNPVTTAGSMQVKVAFARTLDGFDGLSDEEVRERLYTRAGGVRAGTARLLGYQAAYDDIIYRFADYNAGVYASRNAAFQNLLVQLTRRELVLDGDLLAYDENGEPRDSKSKSLQAMLAFGRSHELWDWMVERAAEQEKSEDFEDTAIWQKVRATYEERTGKKPAYARVPNVSLSSPKLLQTRSTAWFAESVKKRYQSCRARG